MTIYNCKNYFKGNIYIILIIVKLEPSGNVVGLVDAEVPLIRKAVFSVTSNITSIVTVFPRSVKLPDAQSILPRDPSTSVKLFPVFVVIVDHKTQTLFHNPDKLNDHVV